MSEFFLSGLFSLACRILKFVLSCSDNTKRIFFSSFTCRLMFEDEKGGFLKGTLDIMDNFEYMHGYYLIMDSAPIHDVSINIYA